MAQTDTDNPQGAKQPNGIQPQAGPQATCTNANDLKGQACKYSKALGTKIQAFPYASTALALGVGLLLGRRARRRR